MVDKLPEKGLISRIPRLQRTTSFHEETNRSTHTLRGKVVMEAKDDLCSLSSIHSVTSCVASNTTKAYRKAITSAYDFRKKDFTLSKNTFHCTPFGDTNSLNEYLTPTQRANRTIHQLKLLLKESEDNNCYKDFEIQRLTREVVSLRLEHAQCGNKITGENKADSGHFDYVACHSGHSENSLNSDKEVIEENEKSCIINAYTEKVRELVKQHENEVRDIKSRFTDRLEQALTQLGDSNTRFSKLLGNYDTCKEELRQSEVEKACLERKLKDLEECFTQLRNSMQEHETQEYRSKEKGVITQTEFLAEEVINEKISALPHIHSFNPDIAHVINKNENRLQVLEQQENSTSSLVIHANRVDHSSSADPSIILKFLRSAIFYLLTDYENGPQHLRTIQSILEFNEEERYAVERMARHGYL